MKNSDKTRETEDGEDVMILGATHRYRTKFVTHVFYKPGDPSLSSSEDDDSQEDEIFEEVASEN